MEVGVMASKKQAAREVASKPASTPEVTRRPREGGMTALRNEMNRLFDRFGDVHWPQWGGRRESDVVSTDPWSAFPIPDWFTGGAGSQRLLGQADFSATDEGFELKIDLPGIDRDAIGIELADGILTVSAERSESREDERKGYYLSERSHGAVRRSFRLPDSVDDDSIKARFQDGVLSLTMDKTEEAREHARRIRVE
jgi:HSP20 family protein